jgi:hypothetical protein
MNFRINLNFLTFWRDYDKSFIKFVDFWKNFSICNIHLMKENFFPLHVFFVFDCRWDAFEFCMLTMLLNFIISFY